MNFVSSSFLLFFLLLLMLLWSIRSYPSLRAKVLPAANMFFYAGAGIMFVPILLCSALLNWGAGVLLSQSDSQKKRRRILAIAVTANLGLLFFFKYYEFFFLQLEWLLHTLGVQVHLPLALAELAFPIGISFYTFQGLAYCIEEFTLPSKEPAAFWRVLAYLSFFPTVLAGPIMRPNQFFPQYDKFIADEHTVPSVLAEPAAHTTTPSDSLEQAAAYIVSGLFKKVVLAGYLSENVVREVFQTPEAYSSWGVLVGVYGYTVQIFCDFSGYTDLAIGIGLLLGFSLPQNFASPYLAGNLQEFWRRWHITLSSWLRDYLYIPLGGSRRGNRYVNLMLTMLLGGLWHGAHSRFLVWGMLHGGGLAVVHAWRKRQEKLRMQHLPTISETRLWRAAAWFLTLHFVAFAWIFFRADDMPTALAVIARMIDLSATGRAVPLPALPAIACGLLIQVIGKDIFSCFVSKMTRLPLAVRAIIFGILVNIVFRMGPDGVLPFIYFQF